MSSSSSKLLFLSFFSLFSILGCTTTTTTTIGADENTRPTEQLMSSVIEWPTPNMSYLQLDEIGVEAVEEGFSSSGDGGRRRKLVWNTMHYYISYGALSANRVPCPPRSGRSYYTNNCFRSEGPAQPYSRGCSKITRCRR